jgi:hypothetical protein
MFRGSGNFATPRDWRLTAFAGLVGGENGHVEGQTQMGGLSIWKQSDAATPGGRAGRLKSGKRAQHTPTKFRLRFLMVPRRLPLFATLHPFCSSNLTDAKQFEKELHRGFALSALPDGRTRQSKSSKRLI